MIVTLSTFQDTCTLKCAVWATTKMLHLSPMYVLGVEGHQSRPTKAAVGAFRTSCCDFRWSASIVKRPASFQPTWTFFFYRSTWIWWEGTERTGRSSSRWRPRRLLDRSIGGSCCDCERVRLTNWYRPRISARIHHLRKWSRWSLSSLFSNPLLSETRNFEYPFWSNAFTEREFLLLEYLPLYRVSLSLLESIEQINCTVYSFVIRSLWWKIK